MAQAANLALLGLNLFLMLGPLSNNGASSAPFDPLATTASQLYTTSSRSPAQHCRHCTTPIPRGDFALNDDDYARLLERLQHEAENAIGRDPSNYLSDDVTVDEIVRMFQAPQLDSDKTSNPSSSNEQDSTEVNDEQISTQADAGQTALVSSQVPTLPTVPECPICLEPLDDRAQIGVIPCVHKFHKTCIKAWFRQNPKCPVCRTNFYEIP